MLYIGVHCPLYNSMLYELAEENKWDCSGRQRTNASRVSHRCWFRHVLLCTVTW